MKTVIHAGMVFGLEAVYFAVIVGVITWSRWRRKTRWPFKVGDRLVRKPGETLRQQIEAMGETLAFELFGGLSCAILAYGVLSAFLLRVPGLTPWAYYAPEALALTAIGISAWRIRRLWRKRANCYLGWFGERLVGECLEPLAALGWKIFHDIPCTANGVKFNIDHVVIGVGGIIALETKTRRKGNARPGFKDNVVTFDGRNLAWPWGADNHGLEQAERNAIWLADMIKGETGEHVHVSPVLVLPGWWVETKPSRNSRLAQVMNPKWLPERLGKLRPQLNLNQVSIIASKIEARCRDVE